LTEQVCKRENLKEALRRMKADKGSAGDGMTVGSIADDLKQIGQPFGNNCLTGLTSRGW